jgi:hypothetical protein
MTSKRPGRNCSVPSIGRCARRAGFSAGGAGRSTVVSRRSRGGSAVAMGSAHAEPSVPVAASRRGGAYGESTGSTRGGGGAAATCSGVGGRDGRGGATTEASEKAASVIPISRCLARRNRGTTTPNAMAAMITAAGTPTRNRRSEDPTRVVRNAETKKQGRNVYPAGAPQYHKRTHQLTAPRGLGHVRFFRVSAAETAIEIAPRED